MAVVVLITFHCVGEKGDTFEGSIRVVAALKWKGKYNQAHHWIKL